MKILKIIFICSSILFLPSCKKHGNGHISGKVTEYGTGQPSAGVGVYITKRKGGTDNSSIVDSTTTDISGNYYLSLEMKNGYEYFIHSNPKNYFTGYASYAVRAITYKKAKIDFNLYPTAYVKFHLQKTSSSTNWISLYFESPGPQIELPSHNYPFDTILPPLKVSGNTILPFVWSQRSSGPPYTIDTSDPLFINKGDTLTYLINYN